MEEKCSVKKNNENQNSRTTPSKEKYQPKIKNIRKNVGQFILGERLGEGTFGVVRLGTHILTGEKVAVKILEKVKILEEADKTRIEREIKILKLLHHNNIIHLYSVIQTSTSIFLIMEYASGKELFDYITLKKRLSEIEACKFYQQIVSGIEYLHKLKIAHRDLKPENLLLDAKKNIKIVDFGLSNLYSNNELLLTACGSPCYAPPEMINGEKYKGVLADIWSSGIILYAMLCGCLPFDDSNKATLYKKITEGNYTLPSFVSEEAKDLIHKVLNVNPKGRITIKHIKNHPWFNLIRPQLNINEGLLINSVVIPIDEELIDKMVELNFDRQDVKANILANKHNHITTAYYLLLNKKVRKNKTSIADLQSQDFLNYIRDPENSFKRYNYSIEEVLLDRAYYNEKKNEEEKNLEQKYPKIINSVKNINEAQNTYVQTDYSTSSSTLINSRVKYFKSPEENQNIKTEIKNKNENNTAIRKIQKEREKEKEKDNDKEKRKIANALSEKKNSLNKANKVVILKSKQNTPIIQNYIKNNTTSFFKNEENKRGTKEEKNKLYILTINNELNQKLNNNKESITKHKSLTIPKNEDMNLKLVPRRSKLININPKSQRDFKLRVNSIKEMKKINSEKKMKMKHLNTDTEKKPKHKKMNSDLKDCISSNIERIKKKLCNAYNLKDFSFISNKKKEIKQIHTLHPKNYNHHKLKTLNQKNLFESFPSRFSKFLINTNIQKKIDFQPFLNITISRNMENIKNSSLTNKITNFRIDNYNKNKRFFNTSISFEKTLEEFYQKSPDKKFEPNYPNFSPTNNKSFSDKIDFVINKEQARNYIAKKSTNRKFEIIKEEEEGKALTKETKLTNYSKYLSQTRVRKKKKKEIKNNINNLSKIIDNSNHVENEMYHPFMLNNIVLKELVEVKEEICKMLKTNKIWFKEDKKRFNCKKNDIKFEIYFIRAKDIEKGIIIKTKKLSGNEMGYREIIKLILFKIIFS